jgi:hypothetical protein
MLLYTLVSGQIKWRRPRLVRIRASGRARLGATGGSQKARVAAEVDAVRADTERRELRSGDIEHRRQREGLR